MLVVKFTRSVEDLEVCPGDANITLCEMLVKFFLSVNKLANLFLVLLLVSFLEKSSPLVSVISHAFGSDLHLKLGNGHLNLEELFNCNDSIRATDNFANLVDFNFVAVSSFLVENAIHLLLQFAIIFLLCILDPVLNFCVGFFEGHDFWVTVQFVMNDLALNVDGGDVVLEEDCVFELALHSFYQSLYLFSTFGVCHLLGKLSLNKTCLHLHHFQVDLLHLFFVLQRPAWILLIFTGVLDLFHLFANGWIFKQLSNRVGVVNLRNFDEGQGHLSHFVGELSVFILLLFENLVVFNLFLLLNKTEALRCQLFAAASEAIVSFLCDLLTQLKGRILGQKTIWLTTFVRALCFQILNLLKAE